MNKGKGGAFSSLGRARVLEIFPFPLKKKNGTFYAGCNNQFAPGKGIQQSCILSGFHVGFWIPGTGFYLQSLVGFRIP